MSTDRLTVQMVVGFIGLFGLFTIGGVILLAYEGRSIPDPLSALGGAAVGALGSLLARTATVEHGVEQREDESGTQSHDQDKAPGSG